jgi:ATP phosphoribosyltransferase regulatory subunit
MADSTALLPNGMIDRMPDSAEAEYATSAAMRDVFAAFGYRLVNPPLLEFEETLLAEGAGKALSTNTFRLMDPVSQRMMALRSDATAQIARIAASRMADLPRPLRLCYIADVLRIRPTQLRPERQFRQAGCELIGEEANAATEIALIALLTLHKAGVRDVSIDFAAPEIQRLLPVRASQRDALARACEKRDRDAYGNFAQAAASLAALDDMTGPAKEFFRKRRAAKIAGPVGVALERLEASIRDLQKALKAYGLDDKIAITVDPLESRGFDYQAAPCFTLFAKNIRGELGRGGAYQSQFGAKSEPACGFTLYLDSVLRALPPGTAFSGKAVLIPGKISWRELAQLQEDGWEIIRAPGTSGIPGKSGDATHIYKNGKMKDI